jgi:hypothetical protein
VIRLLGCTEESTQVDSAGAARALGWLGSAGRARVETWVRVQTRALERGAPLVLGEGPWAPSLGVILDSLIISTDDSHPRARVAPSVKAAAVWAMKFGKLLARELLKLQLIGKSDWPWIRFKELKKQIKRSRSAEDTARFMKRLRDDVQRINQFWMEKEAAMLADAYCASCEEIHLLLRLMVLNYLATLKIVKKHDKLCGTKLFLPICRVLLSQAFVRGLTSSPLFVDIAGAPAEVLIGELLESPQAGAHYMPSTLTELVGASGLDRGLDLDDTTENDSEEAGDELGRVGRGVGRRRAPRTKSRPSAAEEFVSSTYEISGITEESSEQVRCAGEHEAQPLSSTIASLLPGGWATCSLAALAALTVYALYASSSVPFHALAGRAAGENGETRIQL